MKEGKSKNSYSPSNSNVTKFSLGDSHFLRTFRMQDRKGYDVLIKVFVNKLPEISLSSIVNLLKGRSFVYSLIYANRINYGNKD